MIAGVKNTSVQISTKRLNGLEYKAQISKPKTAKAYLLDTLLEKEGVPELTDEDLKRKLKEIDI